MVRAVAVRLASLVGVLLLLAIAVFLIQRLLPADPVRAVLGRNASPDEIAARRSELGFDDPLPVQLVRFLGDLLSGDLGTSLRTRSPVSADIAAYLPATLELVFVATVIALLGGLIVGVLSARGGWLSGVIRVVTAAGASAPSFLLAILGILLLYRQLGLFPAGGRSSDLLATSTPTGFLLVDRLLAGDPAGWLDALHHVLLPAFVLAVGSTVAIARVLRGSLRSVDSLDFVRSARAKGFTALQVTTRHTLRNSLNPALSMTGLQVGMLLSGAVVVETVFSWPGIGAYLSASIGFSDLPAIVGVVLVLGVAYVVINFVVDMLQLVVDPRLRSA
ncbi:ABC transporter permease [Amnibacterium flavum]|uniref:ABC transporter permease n=1 Tax=Amnibacterium flavum TaxID=2173173 RepID=A0A2V1HNJ7_9MICO|nr:ABC transporter permease [Amnibacterium flavum]PVZ94075.1 ABC transporter permease [Amnibacterium flavum]